MLLSKFKLDQVYRFKAFVRGKKFTIIIYWKLKSKPNTTINCKAKPYVNRGVVFHKSEEFDELCAQLNENLFNRENNNVIT